MVFVRGKSGNPSGVRRIDQYGFGKNAVTIDWLIAQAEKARRSAMKQKQPAAAVAALRLIGEFANIARLHAEENEEEQRRRGTDAPPAETREQYLARQRRLGVEAPARPANGSDSGNMVQ